MATTRISKIYISCHPINAALYYAIEKRLNLLKYDIFKHNLDSLTPDAFFRTKGIAETDIFICIISKEYDECSKLRDEFFYAKKNDKRIVFLMADKLDELNFIGSFLLKEDLIKVYKEIDKFMRYEGSAFNEFESTLTKFIKGGNSVSRIEVQKNVRNDSNILSLSSTDTYSIKEVENLIDYFKTLATKQNLGNYFEEWFLNEKQNSKFRIILIGEVSRGKSELINGMLRKKVRNTSLLVETSEISETYCEIENMQKLRDTILIDTPGVGGLQTEHDKKLEHYLLNNTVDAILVVVTATPPPTASLKQLLDLKPETLKYVVLTNRNHFSNFKKQDQLNYIKHLSYFYKIDENDIYQVESVFDYNNDNEYNQTGIPKLISFLTSNIKKKKVNAIKANLNIRIDSLIKLVRTNNISNWNYLNHEIDDLQRIQNRVDDAIQSFINRAEVDLVSICNEIKNYIDETRTVEVDKLKELVENKIKSFQMTCKQNLESVNETFIKYREKVNDFISVLSKMLQIIKIRKPSAILQYALYTISAIGIFIVSIRFGFGPVVGAGAGVGVFGGISILRSKYYKKGLKRQIENIFIEEKLIIDKIKERRNVFNVDCKKLNNYLNELVNKIKVETNTLEKEIETFRKDIHFECEKILCENNQIRNK